MAADDGTPPGRRRGRPQRMPEDPHPIASGVVGCDQRIAWLLAASRALGPDPDLARREGFIAANNQALDVTIATWKSGLEANIDTAIDKWFDDARASVVLAGK